MKSKAELAEMRKLFLPFAEIEPGLLRLEKEIRAVKKTRGKHFCANTRWYGRGLYDGFKSRMLRLVGWDARSQDPRIRTQEAYDQVYYYLYNLLPDCDRGCLM